MLSVNIHLSLRKTYLFSAPHRKSFPSHCWKMDRLDCRMQNVVECWLLLGGQPVVRWWRGNALNQTQMHPGHQLDELLVLWFHLSPEDHRLLDIYLDTGMMPGCPDHGLSHADHHPAAASLSSSSSPLFTTFSPLLLYHHSLIPACEMIAKLYQNARKQTGQLDHFTYYRTSAGAFQFLHMSLRTSSIFYFITRTGFEKRDILLLETVT